MLPPRLPRGCVDGPSSLTGCRVGRQGLREAGALPAAGRPARSACIAGDTPSVGNQAPRLKSLMFSTQRRIVMAGLVPAIHVFDVVAIEGVAAHRLVAPRPDC